jgi:predicted metal-dependent hydrolase
LKRGPERLTVEVGGRTLPVAVVRNRRARRLILRIDDVTGLPVVTLPIRTSLAQGERFLHAQLNWIEARLARRTSSAPFRSGEVFPLRATPCRIEHRPGRGVVSLAPEGEGFLVTVPGAEEFLARRLLDWLKREARHDIEEAVARYTAALGKMPKSIRVGDAKSRWGSCSERGVLTFSWRLVLAPPHALDYLAAHEVAHLVEMNHSPKFWALVEQLYPEHRKSRAWLRAHGPKLHAIGRARS